MPRESTYGSYRSRCFRFDRVGSLQQAAEKIACVVTSSRMSREATGAIHDPQSAIEWAVAFVDRLEAARGTARWHGGAEIEPGVRQTAWCEWPAALWDFVSGFSARGLARHGYQSEVARLRPAIDSGAGVETLSAEDCLCLLTYHVRCDRFDEGHLVAALDRGDLTALLRRLAEIRARGGGGDVLLEPE